MRFSNMLAWAVVPMFCVTTSVFAQTTITYGTPTEVQSTPTTAYSPVIGAEATQAPAADSAPVVTYSPVTPDAGALYTQSAPVVSYYPSAAPVTTTYLPATQQYYLPAAPHYLPAAPRGAVINYRPFVQATQVDLSPTPVFNYRPVMTGVAPVVAYRPVVAAPVVSYRPVVAAPVVSYRPVVAAPVVAYQPVLPAATQSVATYYPNTVAAYPATVAYPVGPTVTVRPKVYVSGEPIRNFFRAITP